jgi:hypothetical protein
VKKFLLLFVGRSAQPAADDAQTQEYNRKWVEWMATLARQGRMESGLPLEPNGKVVKQDSVPSSAAPASTLSARHVRLRASGWSWPAGSSPRAGRGL